ncbi:MAG: lipopolysaccharide transport periplasmic protein LptA [Gammaproteobacteria bacterium]|nr:MAG: lipopolysaccharide transport periplasmic protein LptA [Gammaproteobacteria bacterium]
MCQRHSKFKLLVLSIASALLCLINTSSVALDRDKYQPINVSADSAILDDRAGKAIYRGNVELKQGTLKIKAHQLTIEAGSQGKVEKVIASGELAQFAQQPSASDKPIQAQARTIEYYVTKEKIVLTDQAKVVQNNNLFQGNIIEYDIKQQKLQAKGKAVTQTNDNNGSGDERVKMVLQPQTDTTQADSKESTHNE